MFKCIERWLLSRRDAFVNRHLQAANSFVVVDADTTQQLLALLAEGRVARTTRFPDDDISQGS